MARPGEATTSPRRLLAQQRQDRAFSLRLAGAEYREIAESVGYRSVAAAFEAVKAALKRGFVETAGHELFANLQRLDRLLSVWWPRALGVMPDGREIAPDLAASGEVRAILAERAKLLGLYPQPSSRRQEHINEDLLRQETRALARRMGEDEDAALAEVELLLREQR